MSEPQPQDARPEEPDTGSTDPAPEPYPPPDPTGTEQPQDPPSLDPELGDLVDELIRQAEDSSDAPPDESTPLPSLQADAETSDLTPESPAPPSATADGPVDSPSESDSPEPSDTAAAVEAAANNALAAAEEVAKSAVAHIETLLDQQISQKIESGQEPPASTEQPEPQQPANTALESQIDALFQSAESQATPSGETPPNDVEKQQIDQIDEAPAQQGDSVLARDLSANAEPAAMAGVEFPPLEGVVAAAASAADETATFGADAEAVGAELDEQPETSGHLDMQVQDQEQAPAPPTRMERSVEQARRICVVLSRPLAGTSEKTRAAVGYFGLVNLVIGIALVLYVLLVK